MCVQRSKQFDFGVRICRLNRIDSAIKNFRSVFRRNVYRDLVVRGLRNGADGSDRLKQRLAGNFFRVGQRGFLAADGTNADAHVSVVMTGFNDAFFKHIAFGDRALEIEIGVVDVVAAEKRKSICNVFFRKTVAVQQSFDGDRSIVICHIQRDCSGPVKEL